MKNDYKKEGPFLLHKLSKKKRSVIEAMKINDRRQFNNEYDLLLCRKELELSNEHTEKMKVELSTEKINKFGTGLYLKLRQNTLVSFYE